MKSSIPVLLAFVVAAFSGSASVRAQTWVEGIDVSHWQGNINWNAVAADGIQFAFLKATQGYSYVDPTFVTNARNAKLAGLEVGFYHFTDFDLDPTSAQDPIKQANHFLDVIRPYYASGLYLPPVADVEGFDYLQENGLLTQTFISNWAQSFSDTIYNELGVRPLIYGSRSTANTYYTQSMANQHELWLALWKSSRTTANPPTAADTPKWGLWKFWQYSEVGSVAGISGNVDRDVFIGTREQLDQMLITTGSGIPSNITMISDFELDEGYFGYSPTYSGSNVGILAGTTLERVTTQAYQGLGSQKINVDGDPANWRLREVSGVGSPAANPATNLPLPATGSIGFWLKTSDPGVTVQINIDDPTASATGAIEGGVPKSVIADNQWHLYEWAFQDPAQWNNYAGNGDGSITGAVVSLDSILFTGAGDAVLYMDAVSHNPNGSLLPPPGDFDRDLDVDQHDLDMWKSGFNATAVGDANGDGITDGADLLVWQRHKSTVAGAVVQIGVPEPAGCLLWLMGFVAAAHSRRTRLN